LKVEYVVKPPMTPVDNTTLRVGESTVVVRPACMMAPRQKEPITLTTSVA